MGRFELKNNRFYLSRKLIVIVAFFLLIASILVVLTNFSINIISASNDYATLLSKWNKNHYRTGIAMEEYGRTGRDSVYKEYLTISKQMDRGGRPVDELLKKNSDTALIFKTLSADNIMASEISTLIMAFNCFHELEIIQVIRSEWIKLNNIQTKQTQIAAKIHEEWNSSTTDHVFIYRLLSELRNLNSQWQTQFDQLTKKVNEATLYIKRGGLWISVVLGILLVLIGVVVTIRSSKSIHRWEQSLHEKEILLSEIHHRVKNNLAVISGLLELESMQSGNPEQALKESRDRIHSMAMIHEILYQSQSFSEIRLDHYIKELSDYICNTYVDSGKNIDLYTELDEVTLNINQAVPAGLILNELMANAIEHGFKSEKEGSMTVRLQESQGNIRITLQDSGNGFPPDFDLETTESTGFTIIKALVRQLDGGLSLSNAKSTTLELQFLKSDASGSSSGIF